MPRRRSAKAQLSKASAKTTTDSEPSSSSKGGKGLTKFLLSTLKGSSKSQRSLRSAESTTDAASATTPLSTRSLSLRGNSRRPWIGGTTPLTKVDVLATRATTPTTTSSSGQDYNSDYSGNSSRRSARSFLFSDIDDGDEDVEMDVRSNSMDRSVHRTSNHGVKPHSKEREKLLLESKTAIERKQKQAKLRSRSREASETMSNRAGATKARAVSRESSMERTELSVTSAHFNNSNNLHSLSVGSSILGESFASSSDEHSPSLSGKRVKHEPEKAIRSRSPSFSRRNTARKVEGERSREGECVRSQSAVLSRNSPRSKSPLHQNQPYVHRLLPWHDTILRHDWEAVGEMLQSFDYAKYREQKLTRNDAGWASKNNTRKPQKKLRLLKYLPKIQGIETSPTEDIDQKEASISPLLEVDSNGSTPLHLACTQQMPSALLLKLYFVERGATAIKDNDGRYPIHLALIHNLSVKVLDRLIHSNATSLGAVDNLHHTPMLYAIRKARHLRSKDTADKADSTWRCPTTTAQADWQSRQNEAWEKVQCLLLAMEKRRKTLSLDHEQRVVLQSLEYMAPPSAVNSMFTLGGRSLLRDKEMSARVLSLVFQYHYPVSVVKCAVHFASKCLPSRIVHGILHKSMIDHFEEGRSTQFVSRTFCDELLEAYRMKQLGGGSDDDELSRPCQEWWHKLRFFIAFGSFRFKEEMEEALELNAALMIPEASPSLIEFLCRLLPMARYEVDPVTHMMPLHLASHRWTGGDATDNEIVKILNLLIAGDFTLAKADCNGRLPLHFAALSGKSLSFVQTLIQSHRKGVFVADPVTGLYPFQLAALSAAPNGGKQSPGVTKDNAAASTSVIFELLKAKPNAVAPYFRYGSGNTKSDLTELRRHVLNWFYSKTESGDTVLNKARTDLFRGAIERGAITDASLKRWWSSVNSLIWNTYYESHDAIAMPISKKENLLLATLWTADKIPPIVVELMLELWPNSIHAKQPRSDLLPIHIIAKTPSYTPLAFERTISMASVLEMIVLADPNAAATKSPQTNQLPLHISIQSGKTWQDLRALADLGPETLTVRDPKTQLFPFQQAACRETFISIEKLVQRKTFLTKWSKRGPRDNARHIRRIVKNYDLQKLTCIYMLLRSKPAALDS